MNSSFKTTKILGIDSEEFDKIKGFFGNDTRIPKDFKEPSYINEISSFDANIIAIPSDLKEVAKRLASMPAVVDELYRAEMYARYMRANPEVGAAIAIAKAIRKVVYSGCTPDKAKLILNVGDSSNSVANWYCAGALRGLASACDHFDIGTVEGRIVMGEKDSEIPSFDIEMNTCNQKTKVPVTTAFKSKGHVIFLLGKAVEDIASSQYIETIHGIKYSPAPYFNLEEEMKMQDLLREVICEGMIKSVNSVSVGGLFISLMESAMISNLGFDILTDSEIRIDSDLFGEAQGRVVVTVADEHEFEFIDYMRNKGVQCTMIGHVTKGEFRIDGESFGFVNEYKVLCGL